MLTAEQKHSLKGPVVVVGDPVHQVHLGSWNAADGPVPVVPYPHVEVPGVKVLKVLVERHKVLKKGRRQSRSWRMRRNFIPRRPGPDKTWQLPGLIWPAGGQHQELEFYPLVS